MWKPNDRITVPSPLNEARETTLWANLKQVHTEFIHEISTRAIQFAEFLIKRMNQVHASWVKKRSEI